MTIPPATPSLTRRDLPALALVLLVAAVFRMNDSGRLTVYAYDQATLSTLALDLVSGQSIPLTGIPSSAGIPNSPMTVYVLALPYLFTDDPQAVAMSIATFNVAGVGLLWLLARRWFSPRVALLAGLAYALHPHAIHYSRSIWAQDYHTPILLFSFWLALRGFHERGRAAQALALPVFLIGAQIHYAAWTLLPAFVWLVWVGRRHIDRRYAGLGLVLGGLTLVPFALGIAGAGEAAGATAGGIVEQLDSLILRNKALLYAARLATGLGGHWVGMNLVGEYDVVLAAPSVISGLWVLVGATVVLGLAVALPRWKTLRAVWLWLWAALPFAVFVPNWTGVYPHYFVPILPALALLAAIGVDWLLDRAPGGWPVKAAVAGSFIAILISQGITYTVALREADAAPSALHPTPVHYLMDVREALLAYPDVIISGGVTGESGQPVWKGLLYRTHPCVRELVIAFGGVAIFPDHPFMVMSPPGALPPATGNLYETDAPLEIPLRPGEGVYTIHRFTAAPAWNGPNINPIHLARFENGVELTGYAVDAERVYLRWALPGPGDRGYQYFIHFLNETGERVGQQDASFWPPDFWCSGDTIITWVDAAIPEDAITLRAGLYWLDGERFVNSNIVDASGNPVLPWADITLPEAVDELSDDLP